MRNIFLVIIISINCLATAQKFKNNTEQSFPKEILNTYVYNTKGKAIKFSEMINHFKGKVVYVDFWASWCGPCLREMPESKKIQNEFKDKDVVFLYLSTDVLSADWKKALKKININGYHFRLEPKTKHIFKNKFKIRGIPYYMILDKKLKIFDHKAKWPRQSKLLIKDINDVLNK